MRIHPILYQENSGWDGIPERLGQDTLVLVFAARNYETQPQMWEQLREKVTGTTLLGCSTAGEIIGDEIREDAAAGVVVEFERTRLACTETLIEDRADSFAAGKQMSLQLAGGGLKAVFVLSDGLGVNGTELAKGLQAGLPAGVTVSGGLAGDGSSFQRTWVLDGKGIGPNRVAAVGFYGEHVHFAYGSQGGWDNFGIGRTVTKAEGSVLYELDGKPVLKLYKEYLGEQAEGLPATGLLFPLSIRSPEDPQKVVVRTILQADEKTQSLTFAGDIPVGSQARLMKANVDRLVQGAAAAAEQAVSSNGAGSGESLAIAVSCVGRKLVLGGRAEDELDATLSAFPDGTRQIGFYSYGELAPYATGSDCQLHNQTMTVTRFYES